MQQLDTPIAAHEWLLFAMSSRYIDRVVYSGSVVNWHTRTGDAVRSAYIYLFTLLTQIDQWDKNSYGTRIVAAVAARAEGLM